MEHLTFEFDGGRNAPQPGKDYAVAGVVASSNLEVLAQSQPLDGKVRFEVSTPVANFDEAWKAVFADFVERRQPRDVVFSINDFAAIPPVVALRLDQAWEGLE